MGIRGLLPALKSITQPIHLSQFQGQTIGVDAFVWLYKASLACAYELELGLPTKKHLQQINSWLNLFEKYSITPYLVFDGNALPSKDYINKIRSKNRLEMKKLAMKNHLSNNIEEARNYFKRSLSITPSITYSLMDILRKRNLPFIVAPFEADAQLAFLARNKYVSAVVTEDSDLLVYECPSVIYKLGHSGLGSLIQFSDVFNVDYLQSSIGYDIEKFRHHCILSGCDYSPSIPGVGVKTAAKKLSSMDCFQIIAQYRDNPKFNVPIDYENDFKRADLTFLHQNVFDPSAQRVVNLTSIPGQIDSTSLGFLGKQISDKPLVIKLASGLISSYTHEPIIYTCDADVETDASPPFAGEVYY